MRNGVRRVVAVSACALGVAAAGPSPAGAADLPTGASTAARATAASATDSWSFQAALSPVGATSAGSSGASWITVTGSRAEFKIQVEGLLDGSPHPQVLFIDGRGGCPAAPSGAGPGGGGVAAVGGPDGLGTIGLAVTTAGTTTPGSTPAELAFPTAGSYTYARTVELDPAVAAGIANGSAALVVYGVDTNNNGRYDGAAGRSELGAGLAAEAAAPALCGSYTPMQMAGVPDGAAETGGGSTAATGYPAGTGIGWGQILAGALSVLGVAVFSRRQRVGLR